MFERTSPYEGNGFRHHCRRLFTFASKLMEHRGLSMNEDVAYAIAMWHDLGLVSEQDEGHNYLERSRALFLREIHGFDLAGVDRGVVDQCLLYNHRLFPVPNLCPQAECFRRAVLIEHSRGILRFGLDRTQVRDTFTAYPRDNFDRVLLDFTWRTVKREPLTLVSGVFFGHPAGAST